MHTAKMTIRLSDSDLAFAKRYAREQGLSLTELILRYIGRLSHLAEGDTPVEVRAVAGIVPPHVEAVREQREHTLGKHA
jgi:hypothetical protein